ncbi:MAG: choice-of-anchor I family protein, partial [Verrucomicrobiales bacterium]|nr:choice-of-anchor I family protein [Verrucomicrobiales bacterium]
LLVANEGEYIVGGPGVTPGSVSIVDVSGGFGAPPVNTVGFTAFDGQVATLKAAGVRIFGAELPSNDLEPEYIAVSPDGATAFVTLQENNAVAILNIATATFTNILPLGLKDFSTLLADFSDRDNAAGTGAMGVLTTGNPVFGLYMPDAIASFQSGGQTYYVMANEGDDRDDFLAPDETSRVSALDLDDTEFPNEATLKQNRNLGRLTVTTNGEDGEPLGTPVDQLLALGGRSFSILNAAGAMVYDSDDFIEKTIHSYGTPFHDDSRSDNKASEPEGATVGVVNGRTLAFIGLERANGVMVFDVTDVNTPTFVSFLHHTGDVSPEGLTFVSATESPNNKALLIVTNEVSNTVTVYGFDETTYNLTVTPPTNGTIQGGGVFVENDTAQLLAVPATGYAFTGWTGDASGTVNPLDVLMDADKTIGATFGPDATDTDGNKFSAFEEINLDAILKRYFIGDTVDIDLSFLSTTPGQSIVVTGLPKGLLFSTTTKRITGKILTMLGEVPVEIRKVTGKVLNGSILFNMSVSPYPFVGNYVGLLEKPDTTPEGFFKLFVTGPGVYTANVTLAGQGVRTTKGTFTDPPGSAQRTLAVTFPAGKGGVPAATTVTVVLDSAATSDAFTGNRDGVGVNTLRGFRLAKVGRRPASTRTINVALVNTVPGNGVNVPGGTGYLTGTVDVNGLVRVTGFTGDGKAVAGAFDLSQTNQTVVWMQPYLDKRSYLGGVVTIGDLGLPGRGGSGTAPLAEGIKWFKQADARELSYPAGFALQQIDPQASQWILPPTSVAMGDSLGLAFNEINVSYHNPLGVVNLPTKFRLTERFGLLRIAPNVAVPWSRGVALNKTGTFTGILTLPNGAGVVNGVLLQDASFGTQVGAGLVRVPLPLTVVPRGSFQTIGIDLDQ